METGQSFLSKFVIKKKTVMFLALAAIGTLLLIVGGGTFKDSAEAADAETSYSVRYYTEEMEARIEELCRQVKGVSEVHVLLTLEGTSEYVYAENTSGSARDYVIIEKDGGGEPVKIQEIYPEIRGVAVVCTRGGDSEMQRTITELLSAALGIPSSRIRVAGT